MLGYIITFVAGIGAVLIAIAFGWVSVEYEEESVEELVRDAFHIGYSQAKEDFKDLSAKSVVREYPRIEEWLRNNVEKLQPTRSI